MSGSHADITISYKVYYYSWQVVGVLQDLLPMAKKQVDKPCCHHGPNNHGTECTVGETKL